MGVHKVNYSRQKKKAKEHGRESGPIVCDKRMGRSRECKYCKKAAELFNSDDKKDKDLSSKIRARSTFYMNIIDLSDKKAGVQVYGCGVENWRDLLDRLPDPDDPDDEGIDYIRPKSARAVIIKRKGLGLQTKYTISIGTNKLEIKSKWLKSMFPLHNIVKMIEDDEVELWKPKKGKNKIYILPPWSEKAEGDFYYEVVYHWNTDLLGLSKDGDDEDDEDDDDYEFPDDDREGEDEGEEEDDDVPY